MERLGSSRTNPLHFRLNESMTPCETLVADWQQALTEEKTTIGLEGKHYPVKVTRAQRVPTVEFSYRTYRIRGIVQNPQTSSRWGALARQGNRIMQFKCLGRYVGNVCEGRLQRYSAWHGLELAGLNSA